MSMVMMTAFKKAPLRSSAKFVAMTLANYHNNKTGICNPSIPTIAADTGLSERHVARVLRSLEGRYVITTPDNGRGNSYLLFPKGDAINPRQDDIPTPDIDSNLPLTSNGPTPDIREGDHYKGTQEPICSPQNFGDLFFDELPSTPEPKPKRQPKKNPDADPRHRTITENIKSAYEEAAERPLNLDFGRFGRALKRFLQTFNGYSADDFLNTLQEALSYRTHPKAFHCPLAADPIIFLKKWDLILTELERLRQPSEHRPKPQFKNF